MDAELRVLHVVTHMNRGGLETMLMNYYRNINRNNIQFDFLVHREDEKDYDREIKSLGGRIYSMPPLNPFSSKYASNLDCFFKEHSEYKIVHSHLNTVSAYPLKYAKKHNIPIRIAHSHNISETIDRNYLIKMISKKITPFYSTHFLACSEEAGKWLFKDKDYKVLKNAINIDEYQYNSESAKAKRLELGVENKYVIGHIGRFNAQKNHEFLVDVFSEVIKKKPESVLILIGDGEKKESIKTKVKKLHLENSVFFLGKRNDVPDILEAMDLFMFPSLFEGLPVALLEAQASGLRCIISDGVPSESEISSNVKKISLNRNAVEWANLVLQEIEYSSKITSTLEMKNAGYDICENAIWLEKYYFDLLGDVRL